MRILYDGEVFRYQTVGGINRYFENIIANLPADSHPTLLVTPESDISNFRHPNLIVKRYGAQRLRHFSERLNLERVSYRLDRYLHRRLENIDDYLTRREMEAWDRNASAGRFDLVHPTYYWPITKAKISDYHCPLVISVWDMIYELFPSPYLDPTGERTELKRKAIMAADALICISENTKHDLMQLYSIPENRITVTYLATHLNAEMAQGPEEIPRRPYYLYVGARAPHKNFQVLLQAFAKAASVERDICLCVVSRPQFNDEEKRLIAKLNIDAAIEQYGDVTDEHLAKLYSRSVALVYPSLYEGFGIPPLEAMVCGTPVVVARSSSLPEVVGDAGLYFDPRSADELADIMVDLARNDSLRSDLVSKGFSRAMMFDWKKTAEETVRVYRSLAA